MAARLLPADRPGSLLAGLAGLTLLALPLLAPPYLIEALLLPGLALALAGLGLNLLSGHAGQLSLGSAALMAVGAYAALNLLLRWPGLPLPAVLLGAGLAAAALGLLAGLPSLRLRGLELLVASLALQFAVPWALTRHGVFSLDQPSGVVPAPPLQLGPWTLDTPAARYLFALGLVLLLLGGVARLLHTSAGRQLIALRDHELAARVIGVPVGLRKLQVFAIASFVIGLAGVLWALVYLRIVEPAGFNLDRSLQILFIVLIGGLATLRGAFLGAAFFVLLPLLLSRLGAAVLGEAVDPGRLDIALRVLLGLLILVVLIRQPRGLAALRLRGPRRRRPLPR